jgi:hypothetical protein
MAMVAQFFFMCYERPTARTVHTTLCLTSILLLTVGPRSELTHPGTGHEVHISAAGDACLPAEREEAADRSTTPPSRDTMLTPHEASRGLPLTRFRRRITPHSRSRFCQIAHLLDHYDAEMIALAVTGGLVSLRESA